MGRGKRNETNFTGAYFDTRMNLPGEGDEFNPHFSFKTKVAVDANGNFISVNDQEVSKTPALNRKGKEITTTVNGQEKTVFQVTSPNYKLATVNDASEWAYIENQSTVWGKIENMRLSSYDRNNGKTVNTFKMYLIDPKANELYRIDMRFNNTTKMFFNSLLSLENPKGTEVEISLARTGPEKQYNTIYFKANVNGKWGGIDWKFTKQEDGTFRDEDGLEFPIHGDWESVAIKELQKMIDTHFSDENSHDENQDEDSNEPSPYHPDENESNENMVSSDEEDEYQDDLPF